MPVNKDKLADSILQLINQDDPRWPGFPETVEQAATNWASACATYLLDLTRPASPAAEDGLVAGIPNFENAFVTNTNGDITPLDAGIIAMVESIRVASQLQGISTAPTAAPPFKATFDQYGPSDNVVAISERIAERVDAWLKTATFGANEEPWL